jgi:hypothetical protein
MSTDTRDPHSLESQVDPGDLKSIELEPKENVPAGYVERTADEKAKNRALNLKMDIFLLPMLAFLYLFNGLDRGNVGNAQTQGNYSIISYHIPCLQSINMIFKVLRRILVLNLVTLISLLHCFLLLSSFFNHPQLRWEDG